MAFVPQDYRKAVLQPLSKDKVRLAALQEVLREIQVTGSDSSAASLDLGALFAIDSSMNPEALTGHLKRLEAAFNKANSLPAAPLLKNLLKLFGEEKVGDPAFWASLASLRGQALEGQVEEFAKIVSADRPLKVVTPEEVTELAEGMGLSDVPGPKLVKALTKHGVEVHPDFTISNAGVTAQMLKVTEFPEFRTLVDVVTRPERPNNIRIIDTLAVGNPARRMDPSDAADARNQLQKQEAQVEESARQVAQNVLSDLAGLPSASDFHAVTLASIADAAGKLIRRGVPRVKVVADLNQRGVCDIDARRLVAKLSATTNALRLSDVAELLAVGNLGEARRVLEILKPQDGNVDPEWENAKSEVRAATEEKARLVANYEEALGKRDFGAAARALSGALQIDAQDEGLRTKLNVLPPPPPSDLALRVEGRGVEVAWSANGGLQVQYVVLRTDGPVPVNHTDGNVLARGLGQPRFRDDKASIGVLVRYSVFATVDGSSYSDPVTATTVVLPAPADFAASSGVSDVSLSWTTPPEASGVIVTSTDSTGARKEHRPSALGQLTISGLTTGTKYRFSVRAVYLLAGGDRRESSPVELDAIPRGFIRPVSDMRVETSAGGHRASWSSVIGYPVELWALPVTTTLNPGARISNAELMNLSGRRLTLRPADGGEAETAREFDALPDVCLVVPVTSEGDRGLVGTSQVAGSAPSVQSPTAERFGDEIRLSWEWPTGDYMVEVGWEAAGRSETQRVSRTSYGSNGGVRLPASDDAGEITLATVVRMGSQEWVSAPVSVPVGGLAPSVKYQLSVKRSRFGGKGSVEISVDSPQFRGEVELLTVLKEAKFMPGSSSDGTVVDRRVIDLTAGRTNYTLALGKVIAPFWVRVFPGSTPEVRVEDPPTSQMRGQ